MNGEAKAGISGTPHSWRRGRQTDTGNQVNVCKMPPSPRGEVQRASLAWEGAGVGGWGPGLLSAVGPRRCVQRLSNVRGASGDTGCEF